MNDEIKEDLKDYNAVKADAISAFSRDEFEKALNYIQVAAGIAWQRPIGLWYDEDLDNLLRQIGKIFQESEDKETRQRNHQKIAYIATDVRDIDGCPEALRNWAKVLGTDVEKQDLYITHGYTSFKPICYGKDFFQGININVENLRYQDEYEERIKELIKLINDDPPDFIALFIEPNDVIAVPAIHALHYKPKVIYFNHADHGFWLGRNVIDYLIDYRSLGAKYSKNYRNIDNSHIIPLTTDIKPQKSSREEWNIKKDSTTSISVGSFHKVFGDDQINYFAVIEELLKQFPNHYHLFITNPPSQEIVESYLTKNSDIRERFIITGPFPDLSHIYGLADFLIDTFPINGSSVRIEAMACKLPSVGFYNKKFPIFSADDYFPPEYPFIGTSEDEILNFCGELIKHPQLRRKWGEDLYKHYKQEFSQKKIHESLRRIISNELDTSVINHVATVIDYDIGYSRIYMESTMGIYKNLLLQSLVKRSKFSFKERIEFYSKALEMNEFKSKKFAFMYAIFSVIGWRGLSIPNKMYKIINDEKLNQLSIYF